VLDYFCQVGKHLKIGSAINVFKMIISWGFSQLRGLPVLSNLAIQTKEIS